MPRLVVIGAGGHGKVVVATLQAAGHTVEAVYDDDATKWNGYILGVPVRGPLSALEGSFAAVLGVGDNCARERLAAALPFEWFTAVHPQAIVHPSVRLGAGTVVFAGAVIQPDTTVGRHAIINTAASVDHDGTIGDYCSIGPGAHLAGTVRVGARSALGTGVSVIPNIKIAADVIAGAGAAIIRDVTEPCTLVGVPARRITRPE